MIGFGVDGWLILLGADFLGYELFFDPTDA
jgi:hypothetical protein